MDVNEYLEKLNQFDKATMQILDYDGNIVSTTIITKEDMNKSHEQWVHKVDFDLNLGKIVSSKMVKNE